MSQFTMTINGAAVGSDQQLSVLDPATGRPFAECPDCSEAQLDQAVRAAKAALPTWQGDGDARRAAPEVRRCYRARAKPPCSPRSRASPG